MLRAGCTVWVIIVGLCRSNRGDMYRRNAPKNKDNLYWQQGNYSLVKSSSRLPSFKLQLAVSTLKSRVATLPFGSLLVSRMELGVSPHEILQVSFIITLLSHARHDITFSPYTRKWLLSATLAEILCIHYSIPQCVHFDGNDIVQALRTRKLLEKHDLCAVINDCFDDNRTGIYRVISQDHNGARESLFLLQTYRCSKEDIPD
jgi:hypothetical protein